MLRPTLHAAMEALKACEALEPELDRAAALVLETLKGGRKLMTCGNGGSAADAMHLATEFVCRFSAERRPYPAICLNASGGDLTAIGNDYRYDEVFARQVWAFGAPGDVLIVFTTSGNSENVRRALEAAGQRGVHSIAFLGRGGGTCRGMATVELLVPSEVTARVQEAQKVLLHALCETVEMDLPRA